MTKTALTGRGRPARPKWTPNEKNVLLRHFEAEGAEGCMARMKKLEGRGAFAVKQVARKLGLKEPIPHQALRPLLAGADLEEAIRLREEEGWSFKRIGEKFGICESSASNHVIMALCPRKGFRPAKRGPHGELVADEIERLRALLRKGTKPIDIQLYMGISAGTISNERRQYNAELKSRGKRPLPPPGNGERYSGAKIGQEKKKQVEAIYLAGHGTPKASSETGISYTHCLRIREKLVKRLARKGEALANCDLKGVRRSYIDSSQRVPAAAIARVRALLMDGVGFKRAGNIAGVGDCTSYRIRKELKAELEAQGRSLPLTKRVGRGGAVASRWLPPGSRWIFLYRKLAAQHGDDAARSAIEEGIAAIGALARAIGRALEEERRRRPATFEEQLDRIRHGAGLISTFKPHRAAPDVTLGGIATAAL